MQLLQLLYPKPIKDVGLEHGACAFCEADSVMFLNLSAIFWTFRTYDRPSRMGSIGYSHTRITINRTTN